MQQALVDIQGQALSCLAKLRRDVEAARSLDVKHDRTVALKVLDPAQTQGMATERFLREIHVVALGLGRAVLITREDVQRLVPTSQRR